MSDSDRSDSNRSPSASTSGKPEPQVEQEKNPLEQVTAAAEAAYEQGGEYISRNIRRYPVTALLIAAALGYGVGYLVNRR